MNLFSFLRHKPATHNKNEPCVEHEFSERCSCHSKMDFDDASGDKFKANQQSFMVIQKPGETLLDGRVPQRISIHVLAHLVRNVGTAMPEPHARSCDRL